MRRKLALISVAALAVLLVAPALHAMGVVSPAISRYGMVLGTAGWFLTAPWWIRREA